MLGHKMLHCYPYVPIGGEMALNCAILTYNGAAYFGFSGDVHAAPDLRRLEALLKLSFTELREAAGIVPAPKEDQKKEDQKKEHQKENQKKRKRVRAKAKVALAPLSAHAPASVHASIPPRPVASFASAPAPGPLVEEKTNLTQAIA
jgi:hypothetical protein